MGERRVPPRPSQPNGYAVRLRGLCRDAVRGRLAIVRNASFTARVLGKISATSGSRRTTLVPSAYRAAVTPRTALEKSYSDRIVSSSEPNSRAFLLFFFIISEPHELWQFQAAYHRQLSGPLKTKTVRNIAHLSKSCQALFSREPPPVQRPISVQKGADGITGKAGQ